MPTQDPRSDGQRAHLAPSLAFFFSKYLSTEATWVSRLFRAYTTVSVFAGDSRTRRYAAALVGLLLASSLSLLALVTSFTLTRATRRRIQHMVQASSGDVAAAARAPVRFADLGALPGPVQRYFQYALKEGQKPIRYCALRQRGAFRLRASPGMKASEGWKKVHAQQFFSTLQPGYVWAATISLAPFMWIRGWDSYVRGKGHMLWKLFSALTLVNFGGREIDQSALVRYLSEAVYFPTALLPSRTLRWEPLNDDSARATLVHGGLCVSAVFHFNARGQVVRLTTADRPRRLDDGTVAEDAWTGYYRDYQERGGMQLPMEAEYAWNLVGGTFSHTAVQSTRSRRPDAPALASTAKAPSSDAHGLTVNTSTDKRNRNRQAQARFRERQRDKQVRHDKMLTQALSPPALTAAPVLQNVFVHRGLAEEMIPYLNLKIDIFRKSATVLGWENPCALLIENLKTAVLAWCAAFRQALQVLLEAYDAQPCEEKLNPLTEFMYQVRDCFEAYWNHIREGAVWPHKLMHALTAGIEEEWGQPAPHLYRRAADAMRLTPTQHANLIQAYRNIKGRRIDMDFLERKKSEQILRECEMDQRQAAAELYFTVTAEITPCGQLARGGTAAPSVKDRNNGDGAMGYAGLLAEDVSLPDIALDDILEVFDGSLLAGDAGDLDRQTSWELQDIL
ncbi:hypothetical protein WJX73_000307 [Symbiochloris irregularis]|uniref:BZIP domain-containing protein n=1 Tax=Symbiochloris irregularis TaxID=706552 RepID=A0AAW1P7Y6_9CHLO